jgi:galactonate dehydratase
MSSDPIVRVDAYPLALPREVPYLGPLEPGVQPNSRGYFIRPGNRSIYSVHDHCTLVRVETAGGAVGWGECVAVVAPEVTATIIRDLLAPQILGRDPHDVVAIYEDLYDAMRVRGFFGGFQVDAIAAVDIALWDLRGKLLGLSVARLLGAGRRDRLAAYASGLPRSTLPERAALAAEMAARGVRTIKFAAAMAAEGEEAEMRALRQAVGPHVQIFVDMHWRYTAAEAIRLITRLEAFDLALAEAPVHPEDLAGLAEVARAVKTPIGVGEELRTIHEYLPRFHGRCMDTIQPEMGRMGVTAMWDVCRCAAAHHCRVMPHASIGIGVFQAASLQVSAALPNFVLHEYQHSIFDHNLRYVTTAMTCDGAAFTLPEGPGLGVEPTPEVLRFARAF